MRDALAAATHIASPSQALCCVRYRWPDEDLEFCVCMGFAGCARRIICLTSNRYARMIDNGALATDSVSGLGSW